jgi:hypothetical protein
MIRMIVRVNNLLHFKNGNRAIHMREAIIRSIAARRAVAGQSFHRTLSFDGSFIHRRCTKAGIQSAALDESQRQAFCQRRMCTDPNSVINCGTMMLGLVAAQQLDDEFALGCSERPHRVSADPRLTAAKHASTRHTLAPAIQVRAMGDCDEAR